MFFLVYSIGIFGYGYLARTCYKEKKYIASAIHVLLSFCVIYLMIEAYLRGFMII